MNPGEREIDISQRERELLNIQNNIFKNRQDQESTIYYYPDLEELKKNTSLKPKLIKGFIFCKLILIYIE